MRVLIDIGHPANFLLVKNMVKNGFKEGHEFCLTIRNKEVTKELIEAEGLSCYDMGAPRKGLLRKLSSLFGFTYKLWRISRSFNPDIFVSHSSIYSAFVSRILRKPHISFHANDSLALWQNLLLRATTDVFVTPDSVRTRFGAKQIFYPGNHELAYLGPTVFKPDRRFREVLPLRPGEKYVLVRFVAWSAIDDRGHRGFTSEQKRDLVDFISRKYAVFISSESELPPELCKYRVHVAANKFQDLVYNAEIVVGESGSVASEAAILGVPSVFYSSKDIGFLKELSTHGLCFVAESFEKLIARIAELEEIDDLRGEFRKRLRSYLDRTVNVSQFIEWFAFNYPKSFETCRADPEFIENTFGQ